MPAAVENGPGAEFNFAQYLIELNSGLPAKTAAGKIQRFRLRERERVGRSG
jgi:hypothetical protein